MEVHNGISEGLFSWHALIMLLAVFNTSTGWVMPMTGLCSSHLYRTTFYMSWTISWTTHNSQRNNNFCCYL